MMTTLEITPRISDKTARFRGTVAAGEHVAVTIKGGAEWLGDDNGAHLSLRVIDFVTGRTLALFPRPSETLWDDDEPDAWSTSAEDPNDLFCNLNLNTDRMVNAARHMLRVPVLFVMGAKDDENPATTRTLYFRDRYEVEFWPERVGDDTPYDLDKWPKQIDEWTDLVAEFGTRLATAETSISQTESRANAAISAIPQTVATAVAQSNSGKADKVANATNGNLAALDANGNLDDSGKKPADFADAAQFAAHKDNGDIHVTAAQKTAWTAKYDKPSGGIPKSDLAAAVQTSLGKADSAIQEHQSLAAYVNGGVYDGDAKKILLKHDGVTVAEIDASAFIKDGMISSVSVSNGNLVITFNSDAGKQPISIPLTQIFNPSNYYDKTAADNRFVQKEAGKGLSANDYTTAEKQKLAGIEAGANNYTLPTAGASTLGGVKVGANLSIGENGVLSATVDSAFSDSSTNPVQNKVIATALETGYTDWVFSSVPAWDGSFTLSEGVHGEYVLTCLDQSGEIVGDAYVEATDPVELSFTVGLGSGDSLSVTATRTRITPTKTSQLTNDSGFLTSHQDISGKQNLILALNVVPVPGSDLDHADTISEWASLIPGTDGFWPIYHRNNDHSNLVAFASQAILWNVWQYMVSKLALKADASSLPYALVDVTPTAGAPFVLEACFPIKYTGGGSTVTISASDAANVRISQASSGRYDLFDITDDPNGVPLCAVNADGTFYAEDAPDLTFGANEDTPDSSTQVLGFTPTAQLADRASNAVSLSAAATLVFPAQTAGKARDFVVRLTLVETNGVVPSVTFPADVAYETEGGEWPDLTAAGTYIVRLTEVPKASESETARFFLQCSSAVADATLPSAGGGV